MSAPLNIILKTVFLKLKRVLYFDRIISGNDVPVSSCEVSAEMDGTNHKTSHDGMFKVVILSKKCIIIHYHNSFKVKAVNVKQKYLEEIGGIRVILSGTRITKFPKKNGTVIDIQV